MTHIQIQSTQTDIGDAVQRIHQQFAVDNAEIKTGSHDFTKFHKQVAALQQALADAGYDARRARVYNPEGRDMTHVSGAYRKSHLIVVAGGIVFDLYCHAPVPRDSYLSAAFPHDQNPELEIIYH